MKTKLLFIVSCLASFIAAAQTPGTGKITITVTGDKDAALENATVELLKAKDSSLVKADITDGKGIADFEKIAFGTYVMKVSLVNYAVQYSSVIELSASQTTSDTKLSLQQQSTQLGGVTVTGKKPFIQKLPDRLVVNVDNSIVNAGSSAIDVLERSPGVSIDQNDVIGLQGTPGCYYYD